MRILYFALLRERVGIAEETVSPPPDVQSVADLVAWLRETVRMLGRLFSMMAEYRMGGQNGPVPAPPG